MVRHLFKRSWTLRLAPLFLLFRPIAYWAAFGIWVGCGDEAPENASLLARIGEAEIEVGDLLAFEAGLASAEARSEHGANLQTLIEREVLLLEARARGLAEDAEILAELAKRETKTLADAMLRLHVEEQAVVTEGEIERAYAKRGWGEKIVVAEIFVPEAEKARQVIAHLQQGLNADEVGRLFAVDPYYGMPTGEAKRMAYSPFDRPKALVEAVFALPTGGITESISLHGGYVVAKVAQRRQAALVEVEDGIREALSKEKKQQLRQSYLRHLKWDLGTDFNVEGMERVVGVLQGKVIWKELDEAQRHLPVYAFEGFDMDVEEVLDAVRPSGKLWPKASADVVNEKLAESHFPNKIMAHDARRKGLDQTEAFRRSRAAALGNLMLIELRERILAETPEPNEEELAAFYEENRHRFRNAAWAQLEEIWVEDPTHARELMAQIAAGAEIAPLARAHSQRRKAKDGVLYVSASQAPLFGEVWMNAVLAAEPGQLRGPIQTKGGYSVFKVVEKHPETFYPLSGERVRKSVTRDVRERKEREYFNGYLQELRRKYADGIEVHEEHLQYVGEVVDQT